MNFVDFKNVTQDYLKMSTLNKETDKLLKAIGDLNLRELDQSEMDYFEVICKLAYNFNPNGFNSDLEIKRLNYYLKHNKYRILNKEIKPILNDIMKVKNDLTNLHFYKKEAENLKMDIRDYKKKIKEMQNTIGFLKVDISNKIKDLSKLSEDLLKTKGLNNFLTDQIKVKNSEIVELGDKITELKADNSVLIMKLNDALDENKKVNKTLNYQTKKIDNLNNENKVIHQRLNLNTKNLNEFKLANDRIKQLNSNKQNKINHLKIVNTNYLNQIKELQEVNELYEKTKKEKEVLTNDLTILKNHLLKLKRAQNDDLDQDEQLLITDHLETISIAEIEIWDDKVLRYKISDKYYKVAMYSTNFTNRDRFNISSLQRFHLFECERILKLKAEGKDVNFSINSRKDNLFYFRNYSEDNVIAEESNVQELLICKFCFEEYNNRFFNDGLLKSQKDFNKNKLLPEFLKNEFILNDQNKLDKISSEFIYDNEAIPTEYVDTWKKKAIALKTAFEYKCQDCGWQPEKDESKKYINVHHIDYRNLDNDSNKLRVLCIECHSNQPGHSHIKRTNDYKFFIKNKFRLK